MTVKLSKETPKLTATVYEKQIKTTAEADINVPDICPDISKVLDIDGYAHITEKKYVDKKICICGKVNVSVLYSPDGEALSPIKSLSATLDFSYNADTAVADNTVFNNTELICEVIPNDFEYTLLNSRKINLRAALDINIKLSGDTRIDFPTAYEDTDGLCTSLKPIRICTDNIFCEKELFINKEYEIPSSSPLIGEILKISAFPQPLEFTVMNKKVLAKGQIKTCVVYLSDDKSNVCFEEFYIPFEEIVDTENAEEDMEGEIDYCISCISYDIQDDSDGEPRVIKLCIEMLAMIKAHRIYEPNIICDAYSTLGETELKYENVQIEELSDNNTAQFTYKEQLILPDAIPEISEICDTSVLANVTSVAANGKEVTVSGNVKIKLTYLTENAETPLCTYQTHGTFAHTVSCPNISCDSVIDGKVFTEHISYSLSGSRSAEVRVVFGLCIRAFSKTSLPIISAIDVTEFENKNQLPAVTLCFPANSDTLWSIAKNYHTTVEKIKTDNDIKGDNPEPKKRLIIIR